MSKLINIFFIINYAPILVKAISEADTGKAGYFSDGSLHLFSKS